MALTSLHLVPPLQLPIPTHIFFLPLSIFTFFFHFIYSIVGIERLFFNSQSQPLKAIALCAISIWKSEVSWDELWLESDLSYSRLQPTKIREGYEKSILNNKKSILGPQ